MQQRWVDYGLELKYVCLFMFFNILTHFKVFINIHTYANQIVCIFDKEANGRCLSFYLVQNFVISGKYLLRYD